MTQRRRLPVLQDPPDDDRDRRPGWQWAVLAAAATVLGWTLLAVVVAALAPGPQTTIAFVAHIVALVVASAGGGALAGRFSAIAERRHPVVGAAGAALVALALAARGAGVAEAGVLLAAGLLVLVPCSAAGALLGFRLARRGRR